MDMVRHYEREKMMTVTRNKDYKLDYFINLGGKQWNIYKDKGWVVLLY